MPQTSTLTLLLANMGAAWFLAGLIWTIQLVHYPLFSYANPETFAQMHAAHSARISLIVMPVMILELGAAIFLVMQPPAVPAWAAWLSLALVGVAWLTTALFSVPAHGQLAQSFDTTAHHALVTTNWLRTIAWTLRAVLMTYLVFSCYHSKTSNVDM
jgi:hypothetical protein